MSRSAKCIATLAKNLEGFDEKTLEEMSTVVNQLARRHKDKAKLQSALRELVDNQSQAFKRRRIELARNAEKLNRALDDLVGEGLDPDNPEFRKSVIENALNLWERSGSLTEGAGRNVESIRDAYFNEGLSHLEKDLDDLSAAPIIKSGEKNAEILSEMRAMTTKGYDGKSVTGDEMAFEIAKAFNRLQMRGFQNARDAGIDVRQLDGYTIRQDIHDRDRISAVGEKQWVDYMMKEDLLDKGRVFTDAELSDSKAMRKRLSEMYRHLTEGRDSFDLQDASLVDELINRNSFGSVRSKNAKSRSMHFKSGESLAKYMEEFGRKNLFEIVASSHHKISSHAAMAEIFGTNVVTTGLFDGGLSKGALGDFKRLLKKRLDMTEEEFSVFNRDFNKRAKQYMGALNPNPSNRLVQAFNTLKGWINITKLGGSGVLAGVTDPQFMASTLASMDSNTGYFTMMKNIVAENAAAIADPKKRKELVRLTGLALNSELENMVGTRFSNTGAPGAVSRWQNAFFKYNGLNDITRIHKGTAAIIQMDRLGRSSEKSFDELDQGLQTMLRKHEIDEKEWDIFKQAKIFDEDKQATFVAPELIDELDDSIFKSKAHKRQLKRKTISFLSELVERGVPTPGNAEKRALKLDTDPNSIESLVMDLVAQYKHFAISGYSSVTSSLKIKTGKNTVTGALKTGEGAMFAGQIIAATTALGYLSTAAADMVAGREPRDFDAQVALESFVRGGSAGIYADLVLRDYTNGFGSLPDAIAGPIGGVANDAVVLMQEAIKGGVEGDLTKAARKSIRFAQRNLLPFNNHFLGKAAIDYTITEGLLRHVDEDYVDRLNSFWEEEGSPRLLGD